MTLIQITEPLEDSDHPLSARQALVGLRVEADSRNVASIRALNPNLPRIADTYEVAGRDLFDALWDANRVEHAIYWQDVVRPYLFRIPYGSAKRMRTVRVCRPPYLVGHPVEYLMALCRIEFLLDFDEIAAYFAGAPDQKRPPTRELPVLVSRIAVALKQSRQWRAAEYWQSQWEVGFLPIPVEYCQLYDVQ
jgi:hypothetical protein